MYQRIAHIALVVDNYDDAIDFYRNMLDFVLVEDTQLGEKKVGHDVSSRSERMLSCASAG